MDNRKKEHLWNSNLFKIISDDDFFRKFAENGKNKFYLGIDPTAPGVHLGHLISIKLGIELLKHGCEAIILIGGFTGKIGDPTDKNEARKKLEDDAAEDFSQGILSDLKEIFRNYKVNFVNNKTWLDKMTMSEYLNISYNISIARKINLETFHKRITNNLPLTGAEFMYPDIQMIDFLELNRLYGCNIQIGGADQWGNISYGVHYVKKITKQENIFGLCTPLLTVDGVKVSKTDLNPPFVNNPFNLYQFIFKLPFEAIGKLRDFFCENENISDSSESRHMVIKSIFKVAYRDFEEKFQKVKEQSEQMFYAELSDIDDMLFHQTQMNDLLEILSNMDDISKSEIKRKMKEGALLINNNKAFENLQLDKGKYRVKIGKKVYLFKVN